MHILLKRPIEQTIEKLQTISPSKRKKQKSKKDPNHFIIRDLFGIKQYNFYKMNQFESNEGQTVQ